MGHLRQDQCSGCRRGALCRFAQKGEQPPMAAWHRAETDVASRGRDGLEGAFASHGRLQPKGRRQENRSLRPRRRRANASCEALSRHASGRLPGSGPHWLVVVGLGVSSNLEGTEIQLVSALGFKGNLGMTSEDVGFTGPAYLIGQVVGALVFGRLTDVGIVSSSSSSRWLLPGRLGRCRVCDEQVASGALRRRSCRRRRRVSLESTFTVLSSVGSVASATSDPLGSNDPDILPRPTSFEPVPATMTRGSDVQE